MVLSTRNCMVRGIFIVIVPGFSHCFTVSLSPGSIEHGMFFFVWQIAPRIVHLLNYFEDTFCLHLSLVCVCVCVFSVTGWSHLLLDLVLRIDATCQFAKKTCAPNYAWNDYLLKWTSMLPMIHPIPHGVPRNSSYPFGTGDLPFPHCVLGCMAHHLFVHGYPDSYEYPRHEQKQWWVTLR